MKKLLRNLSIYGLLFAGAMVLVGVTCGKQTVEKTLTALALPCGILWLGLAAAVLILWGEKRRLVATLVALLFALYTLAGNSFVGHWAMTRLEREFYDIHPLEGEPYDLVIVLGGGMSYLMSGQVQSSAYGDRVLLAARMYHRGKVRQLVATGTGFTPDGLDPIGAARAAAQVWQDLGVPPESISLVPGSNTFEEAANLKEILNANAATRVGLLTSAWHLPRALRLAKKQELDVLPVPANFMSNSPRDVRATPQRLVPKGENFLVTAAAAKEFLAAAVGR